MESILIKKILEKDQRYGFNLLSWTEDRLFSKAEEEEMDLIYPLKKREIKFSIDRQEVLIYSMTLL